MIVGRVATKIATILRGKHKVNFAPHIDMGDFIIVINAKRIRFTGNKEINKQYFYHTGYVGGIKRISVKEQRQLHPQRILMHAVRGMLPKNSLGRAMLKKLKIYDGNSHPHLAQMPIVLDF